MYGLIWLCNLQEKLDEIELLILLVAAICHDLDHPGYNNAYQVHFHLKIFLCIFTTLLQSSFAKLSFCTDYIYRASYFMQNVVVKTSTRLSYVTLKVTLKNSLSPQVNAKTELALRYNDISPLENHHAAVAFEILSCDSSNIIKHLNPDNHKRFRSGMIKLGEYLTISI